MSLFRTAALILAVAALALASAAPPKGGPKPKAPPTLLNEERIDEMLQSVARFPEVEEPRITLRELLLVLGKTADLPGLQFSIVAGAERQMAARDGAVAARAGDEAQLAARLPAGTMTVEQRLKQTLAAVTPNLVYLLRRGHVEITTASAALRELRPTQESPLDDEMQQGAETLPPMVSYARFNGETLEDACAKVAERAGINVAIDPRSKDGAAVKIKARLVNVPADDALAVLADMAGLAVVRKANLYYLTAPKNAGRLKPPPPMFPPGGAMQLGGMGAIGGAPPGGGFQLGGNLGGGGGMIGGGPPMRR